MKKTFWSFIIVILLIGLAVWAPWNNWNLSWKGLLGLEKPEGLSGLTVYSLAGTMEVYVDSEFQGEASPSTSPYEIDAIDPTEHKIELVRKGTEEDSYFKFSRTLNFQPGINSILSYELGPTKEFSAGYIFYASSKGSLESKTTILINSNPDGAKVSMDDVSIGNTPIRNLEVDVSKTHKLKFEADGYEPLEFEILPTNQKDRDKLKGYDLVVETNLFRLPNSVVEELSE
jgi:hypothetical protein